MTINNAAADLFKTASIFNERAIFCRTLYIFKQIFTGHIHQIRRIKLCNVTKIALHVNILANSKPKSRILKVLIRSSEGLFWPNQFRPNISCKSISNF